MKIKIRKSKYEKKEKADVVPRKHISTTKTEEARRPLPISAVAEPPAMHIFSCHCGYVQAELLVPLAGLEVKEDNCSGCVRVSDQA